MKRSLQLVVVLLALVLPMAIASANDSIGSLLVYPAAAPLTLDGFADDWGVGGLEPTIRIHPDVSFVNEGELAGPNELSADIYLLYDDEYVYVAARVVDDNVVGNASGGSIWTNSVVETWFAFSASPANPADYANYTASDYQINLSPMTVGLIVPQGWVYPPMHDAYNTQNPVAIASSLWTKQGVQGYLVEARIPKASYPGFDTVKPGSTFRFAVSMVHNDKDGSRDHVWTPGVEYAELTVR